MVQRRLELQLATGGSGGSSTSCSGGFSGAYMAALLVPFVPLCVPCCGYAAGALSGGAGARGGIFVVAGAAGGKNSVLPARCGCWLRRRRLASFEAASVYNLPLLIRV